MMHSGFSVKHAASWVLLSLFFLLLFLFFIYLESKKASNSPLYLHFFLRYGEPGGAGAGGERLPHALPTGLPRVPSWDDEALLEERARREAHLRVPAVLPGGLFHRHRATVPAWRKPLATPGSAVSPYARPGPARPGTEEACLKTSPENVDKTACHTNHYLLPIFPIFFLNSPPSVHQEFVAFHNFCVNWWYYASLRCVNFWIWLWFQTLRVGFFLLWYKLWQSPTEEKPIGKKPSVTLQNCAVTINYATKWLIIDKK